MTRHPLSRSALYMLPVGYLILWSDAFSELFRFSKLGPEYLWLSTDVRLYLVYFGALFVALGTAIVFVHGPSVCRKFESSGDYFAAIVSSGDINAVLEIPIEPEADPKELVDLGKHYVGRPLIPDEFVQTYKGEFPFKKMSSKDHTNVFQRGTPANVLLSSFCHSHFNKQNQSNPAARTASILITGIGISLVIIPSIEVCGAVVIKAMSDLARVL